MKNLDYNFLNFDDNNKRIDLDHVVKFVSDLKITKK